MAYTVKSGDTFNEIAASLGMSSAELRALNPDIKDYNKISINQQIITSGESKGEGESSKEYGGYAGQELNNVGGKPEVWKIGNDTYLVYMVPGTESDPVYMMWAAPSQEDVQSWFGPDAEIIINRTISSKAAADMGMLDFGSTDELGNLSGDPFAGWESELEMQAQTQPWILDADYQGLMAMAVLEGRQLTRAEIATTEWWSTHTAAEREWMTLFNEDPSSAQVAIEDNESKVRDLFRAAGAGMETSEAVITFMAGQFTRGGWSMTYLNDQITALTDKASGVAIDPELAKMELESIGQTTDQEGTVRDLLHTWLGPAFGDWSEEEISRIAGLLRNDPTYEDQFVEQLKDQRMAVMPGYTDRDTSYQAIANTWKQWWVGQWGEQADETDALFQQVLQLNDTNESGKLLREEGLKRGIGKVAQDFSDQSMGVSNRVRAAIG